MRVQHYKDNLHDFYYYGGMTDRYYLRLILRRLPLETRVFLQRQWFKLFPKKYLTKTEICDYSGFCNLPDNVVWK